MKNEHLVPVVVQDIVNKLNEFGFKIEKDFESPFIKDSDLTDMSATLLSPSNMTTVDDEKLPASKLAQL